MFNINKIKNLVNNENDNDYENFDDNENIENNTFNPQYSNNYTGSVIKIFKPYTYEDTALACQFIREQYILLINFEFYQSDNVESFLQVLYGASQTAQARLEFLTKDFNKIEEKNITVLISPQHMEIDFN